MLIKRIIFFTIFSITACQACSFFRGSAEDTDTTFSKTDAGTPIGPVSIKDIGPAGGSISSPDGKITVKVPPNAVAGNVDFGIQPITNQTEDAFGGAYRLTPDGQKFSAPVEVSFKYDDQVLDGSVPEALTIGYQAENGEWRSPRQMKLDQAAKTLTISTTHFTDYAFYARIRLSPPSATVFIGSAVPIYLIGCKDPSLTDRFLHRNLECSKNLSGKYNWTLQGAGNLNESGTVNEKGEMIERSEYYTAPLTKPVPNKARVCLTIDLSAWNSETGETTKIQKTFETKITIVDRAYKATGSAGTTTYTGIICDIQKPFKIKTNNPFYSDFEFTPSTSSGGLWKTSMQNRFTGGGGGGYTLEGSESLWTGMVVNGSVTGCLMGYCGSGSGPLHVTLTPLTGNEGSCGD